jgi:hypothetical protein
MQIIQTSGVLLSVIVTLTCDIRHNAKSEAGDFQGFPLRCAGGRTAAKRPLRPSRARGRWRQGFVIPQNGC